MERLEEISKAPLPLPETVAKMHEIEDSQSVDWVTQWLPVSSNERTTNWLRFGRKSNDVFTNHPGFSQITEWDNQTVNGDINIWTFLIDETQLEEAIERYQDSN